MADIGQIDNYSFGRSGNSNILTSEIIYEPIAEDSLNTNENNSTYYFKIDLSRYSNLTNFLNSAKLLSILITTEVAFKIKGTATGATIQDNNDIHFSEWNNVNYKLNNSSLNIPIMKDNVITLYLILDGVHPNTKVTINGVWLQLNNADANFFQLQSQMAGLQMQASSIIQQLNNAMQYCNSLTSMTSKYGVGDIYITTSKRDPNIIYGGTWEEQKNCILVGATDNKFIPSVDSDITSHKKFNITKSMTLESIECRLNSEYIPAHTHRIGYWT